MKDKKQKIYILLFILILVAVVLILPKGSGGSRLVLEKQEDQVLTSELKAHFIDVGQGDSIFIQNKDKNLLIDGGTRGAGDKVVEYLEGLGVDRIDYIIGTHPHEDHIGGLYKVINKFEVGDIIMPNKTHTTKTFENLLDTIIKHDLSITPAVSGEEYRLADAKFLIIAPNSDSYSNLNDYSVGIKLSHGEKSFIFTGDAELTSENEIVKEYGDILGSDVLKLGHHGSNTSTSKGFIEKIRPKIGVISAGKDNKYNHPNKETIDTLEEYKVKYYKTYEDGDIVIISDGKNLQVLTSN